MMGYWLRVNEWWLWMKKQKDEPPEITYCVVNQNGMLHLQTLSPAQPMPDQSELDAKFTELLVIIIH